MRKDKEKAIVLRQRGLSYKQIQRELGVPIGTLSGWFKNSDWSNAIKDKLSAQVSLSNPKAIAMMAQANRERWAENYRTYRREAERDFPRLKKNPLFIAGIMLYWGEGDNSQKTVQIKLTNSDPSMLKIYYLFLLSLGISPDRISARLLLYPDLKESVLRNFWSVATTIPLTQFKKAIFIKGKQPAKRLSYGVCSVSVSNRRLKEKILRWIELFKDHIPVSAS